MFPYRPVHLNSRVRILVAAILAIAFHAALIKLEFTQKPVWVPVVSFPRDVNVFLSQEKAVEKMPEQAPEKPVEKKMKSKTLPTEPELEPVAETIKNIPTPEEKKDDTLRVPVIQKESLKRTTEFKEEKNKPAVEEITPESQELPSVTLDSVDEAGKNADEKVREVIHERPPVTSDDVAGQETVGIIRMAYPDYRLNAPPSYPVLARKRGQEGTVLLQVLVTEDGRVDDLEIETSSGFRLLDRAALTAVRKWQFEPGRRGKEIIPMWVRVPVTFKLKN